MQTERVQTTVHLYCGQKFAEQRFYCVLTFDTDLNPTELILSFLVINCAVSLIAFKERTWKNLGEVTYENYINACYLSEGN